MSTFQYPLSVIIPIHRANLNIERCIDSLLANDRLDLQIIVAANSDNREELYKINRKVRKCYSNTQCVLLLNNDKAGKANAINNALRYVKNEIVLIGDADTFFYRKGLNKCLSAIFHDKSVVAVTGNVDVYQRNFLSIIQFFEYRRIFRIFRPLWNRINGNLMISGCAGIFRTKCLFEVGLYDTHTIGEDFEITLRLHDYYIRHKIDYKIKYINTTLAKTDAPLDFKSFIKQRKRWFLGFLQVTERYRKIILHPKTYHRIFFPFVFSLITEKWSCYLKWVLIAISIGICVYYGVFPLHGVFLCFLNSWIFEVIFNCATMKRMKLSDIKYPKVVSLFMLTFCLMAIQFFMKDTNVFRSPSKRNRPKENKWE